MFRGWCWEKKLDRIYLTKHWRLKSHFSLILRIRIVES